MIRSSARMVLSILAGLLVLGCVDTTSYQYLATEKGLDQFKAGDYATAAGSFTDALRHEPRYYRAEYYLAACHDELKMHQQAVSEYKATLQIMNTTSQGRRDKAFRYQVIDALAQSIARGSDVDSQIAQLQSQSSVNSAENYYLLAKVYQYAQDADSAITAYEKATLLDPSNAKYAGDYGLFLNRIGQTGKAEQQLRKAQSLGNKDQQITDALRQMGSVAGASTAQPAEPSEPKTPGNTPTATAGPRD